MSAAVLLGFSLVLTQAPASGLKDLQGAWEVQHADSSAGVKYPLPVETGLARKGAPIIIRGNEVLQEGKVVATLTVDFTGTGLGVEKQTNYGRSAILFTLPDGRGVLWAYKLEGGGISLAYPHTVGRIYAGCRLSLVPAAKQ